ncbi:amidase [Thalassomonas actiniarum]|uniref:Amidase n=1 Tax=Thalassomonas actiniarum TaxID=485447 RepID=A0AAF0C3C0_9GAMM|nr:amidase [Thalassomonas actiniarum]WDD98798.1 amidase [Thalassomonas actiniarum]
MNSIDIQSLSIDTLVSLIAQGQLSSEQVTEHYIAEINAINPKINALVRQADFDGLRAQAKAADEAVKNGESLGRLHGIPLSIKDMCKVKGFNCTLGTLGLKDFVADSDATIVARLKQEGALILGITNTPELLMAFETDNLLYGRCNHPLDVDYSPGGSSGGEAALIGGGGSPAGMGSDSMGSVRVPSSYCGIAGLKVTQGRLPQTGRVPEEGAGLHVRSASYGPMGRYVDDVALLLDITHGPDGIDPNSPPVSLNNYRKVDLATLSVAWYDDNGLSTPDDEVKAAIAKAADKLGGKTASCEWARPDCLEQVEALALEMIAFGADAGRSWANGAKLLGTKENSPLFDAFLTAAQSCDIGLTEMRGRLRTWDKYNFTMNAFSEKYDITLCPVTPTTAFKHTESSKNIRQFTYTMAYSLTGQPVATVNIGNDSRGFPIGIQIVGRLWCEHQVLAVAKYLENTLGGYQLTRKSLEQAS